MTPARLLSLLAFAAATLPGCRPADRPAASSAAASEAGLPAAVARNRLRGVVLDPAQPKPDLRLTTVDGQPFDFRRDTKGKLALLFFGYTHCPDICPLHMANLGRVLQGLPSEVTSRIVVVFVTTDPERDTPARLKGWLANFGPGFVGLTGSPDQVRNAQLAAQLMPAIRELPDSAAPDAYLVSHAAQVIAYTSDDLAHIVYPFGIRQQDWANDLPILAQGWPE